jgi:hypothetical protein
VHGKSKVVILAKTRQVSVDRRRAHVNRRGALVMQGFLNPFEDFVQLCALAVEIELGEILVVEQAATDFRPAK